MNALYFGKHEISFFATDSGGSTKIGSEGIFLDALSPILRAASGWE
jgi:hypothetical protein